MIHESLSFFFDPDGFFRDIQERRINPFIPAFFITAQFWTYCAIFLAYPVLATNGYSLSWAHFQIYFLGNVTLWLLYSLILFIVPNHYGGTGPFFAVLQNVGYAMVPIALHNVVSILVILWFKL